MSMDYNAGQNSHNYNLEIPPFLPYKINSEKDSEELLKYDKDSI